jgi:site-specific recombinase XerD
LKKVLLDDLIENTKQHVVDQNFNKCYRNNTFVTFRQLTDYAAEKGELFYSTELVNSFLSDEYDYPANDRQISEREWGRIRRKITHLKKLEWIYECDKLERQLQKVRKPLPSKWQEVLGKFEQSNVKRNFSENTKSRYATTLNLFAEYMIKSGVVDIVDITPTHISEYILSMKGHAPTTMQSELGRIRRFFKFAYLEKYTDGNLELAIPKFGHSVPLKDANIWSKDELNQLLSVIDCGNATGKRDYAIIVMAIDLGMRTSDIISLTFENFDWGRGSIEFNQRKTKSSLTLPLSERAGLAIIDYLKYARPKTVCQNVFVRHSPPYDAISKFSEKFHWYVRKAGITKDPNRRYGMHSLRNTVATRMLENGIPFDMIFPFVGHSDENTLNRYLGMDIENLRKCALSFEAEGEDERI